MKKAVDKLQTMRHSCAHVLAAAVKKLYPETKFAIGPSIENGFYYDFEFPSPLSKEDFSKISAAMNEIVENQKTFIKKRISIDNSRKLFRGQPYKLELIRDLKKEGRKMVQIYYLGAPQKDENSFFDLCQGPHVEHTGIIGPFRLTSIAGAYWRGDEKKPMLTRIYGTCFATKKQLDAYLARQEEAKEIDHRKLGKELDLFHFSPQAPGMPFWHPKGVIIFNELIKFWREVQKKYAYQEVKAPELLSVDVFKQSGHWDHFRDKMFFTEWDKNEKYALKPMDCPGEIEIYQFKTRSYRELPLRFAEIGLVHRKEKKGELNGLLRVAHVTQDDAHIFCTEDQIKEEVTSVIKLAEEIYLPFQLDYGIFLSTRPDKFMGKAQAWEKAETALKEALRANQISYQIKKGEGAFYGPKIDYDLRDALGRTWQCATIQLDFFMPQKFKLTYVDKDGKEKRPVIIHRTILGALERFIGILIEHYAGALPVWLAPSQVIVIPISNKVQEAAQLINQQLKALNLRSELDDRQETASAKIRDAELKKIPYMLIVGEKEIKKTKGKEAFVSVRQRGEKELGLMPLKQFLKRILKEIEAKS